MSKDERSQKDPNRHVSFHWAEIVQKGMQEAHIAFMAEVRKHKPSNPRSPTYAEDVSEWQKILDVPVQAQAEALEGFRKGSPRNQDDVKIKKVMEDLAKVNESYAKVKADFADLEKKYKDLDGKYKSLTRKHK